MSHFFNALFKKITATYIVIALFVFFIGWWALFFVFHLPFNQDLWGICYQAVSWCGIFYGLYTASFRTQNMRKKRILYTFSIGLLLQCIGQTLFGIYAIFFNIPVPYPGWDEIAFFVGNLFYLYGVILFFRSENTAVLQSTIEKFQAVLLMVVMYTLSYIFFLKGYYLDLTHPVTVFLDFGYPLVQATYVSLTIILSASSTYARLFLPALIMQYFADFNFIYNFNHGTWVNYTYGDLIYLSAFFLMALAIIHMPIQKTK